VYRARLKFARNRRAGRVRPPVAALPDMSRGGMPGTKDDGRPR